MPKSKRPDRVDHQRAAKLLREEWKAVVGAAESKPAVSFIDDANLCDAIGMSINHGQVSYRYCLPIQLLGKLTNPRIDSRRLQRGPDESVPAAWDARSLGSKVIAPFIKEQESVLGTSGDPYVGNPMRIPRMERDDKTKSDIPGWNRLLDVLDAVEKRQNAGFTRNVFRQVLLEIYRRQRTLRFSYPVPPRISLKDTLEISERFLSEKSGGDRALALAGALFDVIGSHFGLFGQVNRARINASDEAVGQVADLECVDETGKIVLAVEVKDRALTLADVEGTITKTRRREIQEVFFTTPKVNAADADKIKARLSTAFATGQSFYVFDFFGLARAVLALGGNAMRRLFLQKVGDHLDIWNTQPSHRQAWKQLLESL
jgi:SacI restriction endonuclease.